jgi:protein-S-isoprenylcysteine O-methyltransferase Ste14
VLSLFIRNFIFTILQPGIVAGLIPYLILGDKVNRQFVQPFQFVQYAGTSLGFAGLVIMFHCIINFAVKGKGTLSPADPTKKLVTTGLYRFSRNPMYVGVTLILIGETIFFLSVDVGIYCFSVFIAFTIFTMLVEEPRLRRDFGEEYTKYCGRVRRWI